MTTKIERDPETIIQVGLVVRALFGMPDQLPFIPEDEMAKEICRRGNMEPKGKEMFPRGLHIETAKVMATNLNAYLIINNEDKTFTIQESARI